MTILGDFLNVVLPWGAGDHKVVMTHFTITSGHDAGKRQMMHRSATTPGELEKLILELDARQNDVWIALQSFNEPACVVDQQIRTCTAFKKVHRRQADVALIKAFWVDCDVKEGAYASLQAAIDDMIRAAAEIGLPPPTLQIASGGGLHTYWVFDTPIDQQTWKPVAHWFANALRHHKVLADAQCTVDSVRVLRPPSTWNRKIVDNPRPVQMLAPPGATYPFDLFKSVLQTYGLQTVAGTTVSPKNGLTPAQAQALQNFGGNLTTTAPPVDLFGIADAGCLVFQDALDTHGATASQGLWNLIGEACTFDLEPETTFHEMSSGHPTYVPANTDAMIARKIAERTSMNRGWPTCQAFSVESTACQSCTVRSATLRSPLNLMGLVRQAQAQTQAAPNGVPLPSAEYWYDLNTGYVVRSQKDKEGNERPMTVLPYKVMAANLNDERELVLELAVGTETEFVTVGRDCSSPAEFGKCFSIARIMVDNTLELRKLCMAWVTNLQTKKGVTIQRKRLGWDGDSFSFGEFTYTPTGKEKALYVDEVPGYRVIGDVQPWLNCVKMVTDQNHPALETLVLSGGASPLIELMGVETPMLAAYSVKSGTFKSTAMKIGQAMWGDPIAGRNSLSDTENALMAKLGNVRHLPVYYDEIKTKDETEKLVRIAFQIGQGKEKARLDSSAKARESKKFATLLVSAANRSLADVITSATDDSSAGAMRVFEITVAQGSPSLAIDAATKMVKRLEFNHGRAGEAYAEFLVQNRVTVEKVLEAIEVGVRAQLGQISEERFWISTIVAIVTAAHLCNAVFKTGFHPSDVQDFLVKTALDLRTMKDKAVRDMGRADRLEELMADLISSTRNRHMIETDILSTAGGGNPTSTYLASRLQSLSDVWVQFATSTNEIRVQQARFHKWLEEQGLDRRVVLANLHAHGMTEGIRRIGANVLHFAGNTARVRCYDIDLARIAAATP